MLRSELPKYWADEGEDYVQIRALPRKWMDLSRFKVGDKIEYLKKRLVYIGPKHDGYRPFDASEWVDMKDTPGVVTEVHNGYGFFAQRDEHEGWLCVKFERTGYCDSTGKDTGLIALHPSDENIEWKKG